MFAIDCNYHDVVVFKCLDCMPKEFDMHKEGYDGGDASEFGLICIYCGVHLSTHNRPQIYEGMPFCGKCWDEPINN